MSSTPSPTDANEDVDEGRRDFIHLLAVGTTAAAGLGIAIPLVHQMNPAADVRALATKQVSIAGMEPGQAIKVIWQGKPVFIRRLTEAELSETEAKYGSLVKDGDARNDNAPGESASPEFRVAGPDGAAAKEYVVVLGVCTHLGCVPLGTAPGENKGDYGGWFCPCHGSHYDAYGRIIKGPAPQNLPVPPLSFLSETSILLG